jgi:hypothetical protein
MRFYSPGQFALPSTGLQMSAQRSANGGVSFYTPASTANPTGRRPWNSRLSFYEQASFALPSTGLAIPPQRFPNGGMGDGTIDLFGVSLDPTLLAMAGAVLLLGVYLYGPKRGRRR